MSDRLLRSGVGRLPSMLADVENSGGRFFMVLALGAAVGLIVVRHPSLAMGIAGGLPVLAGLVLLFSLCSRYGVVLSLICIYFLLSIIDPSKNLTGFPVFGEGLMRDMPQFKFFTPTISSLLALLLIVGVVQVLTGSFRRVRITSETRLCAWLLIILTAYGVVNGLVRGTTPSYVFGDALYLAGYALFVPFSLIIVDCAYWRRLSNGFLVAVFALCIEGLLIFGLSFADFTLGGMIRVWLRGGMFFQVGAVVSLAVLLTRGEGFTSRRRYLYGFFCLFSLVGLVLQGVRSYYLGFGASLFVLVLLSSWGTRMRLLLRGGSILVGLFLLGSLLNVPMAQYVVGRWGTPDFYASLGHRQEQLPLLLGYFYEAPLLGQGLGATIEGYYEPIVPRTSGQVWEADGQGLTGMLKSFFRQVQRPYIYELDYVALLMKFGLFVIPFWLAFWALIISQGIKVARRIPPGYHRALLNGYVAGFVGLLVSGATNPLMGSVLLTSFVGLVLALINAAAFFNHNHA